MIDCLDSFRIGDRRSCCSSLDTAFAVGLNFYFGFDSVRQAKAGLGRSPAGSVGWIVGPDTAVRAFAGNAHHFDCLCCCDLSDCLLNTCCLHVVRCRQHRLLGNCFQIQPDKKVAGRLGQESHQHTADTD